MKKFKSIFGILLSISIAANTNAGFLDGLKTVKSWVDYIGDHCLGFALSAVPVAVTTSIMHELGHAIVGSLAGNFHSKDSHIGFVMCPDGLKTRYTNVSFDKIGAMTTTIAGPLAGIAASVLLYKWASKKITSSDPNSFKKRFWQGMMASSILAGLFNVYQFKPNSDLKMMNDGAKLLKLWNNDPELLSKLSKPNPILKPSTTNSAFIQDNWHAEVQKSLDDLKHSLDITKNNIDSMIANKN